MLDVQKRNDSVRFQINTKLNLNVPYDKIQKTILFQTILSLENQTQTYSRSEKSFDFIRKIEQTTKKNYFMARI